MSWKKCSPFWHGLVWSNLNLSCVKPCECALQSETSWQEGAHNHNFSFSQLICENHHAIKPSQTAIGPRLLDHWLCNVILAVPHNHFFKKKIPSCPCLRSTPPAKPPRPPAAGLRDSPLHHLLATSPGHRYASGHVDPDNTLDQSAISALSPGGVHFCGGPCVGGDRLFFAFAFFIFIGECRAAWCIFGIFADDEFEICHFSSSSVAKFLLQGSVPPFFEEGVFIRSLTVSFALEECLVFPMKSMNDALATRKKNARKPSKYANSSSISKTVFWSILASGAVGCPFAYLAQGCIS